LRREIFFVDKKRALEITRRIQLVNAFLHPDRARIRRRTRKRLMSLRRRDSAPQACEQAHKKCQPYFH
jgi:hypothetical protein